MPIELRYYQRTALDKLYAYWRDGGGNALIDLATGTGKSMVGAAMFQELLGQYPDMRIGSVTHVKELISQNAQELLQLWPAAPIGIYSAGLGRRDRNARIIFCGIQSVYNKDLGDFDLLLVDEAHLVPKNAETMYGKFIIACRNRVPDMRLCGLTATPYRLGSGRLDEGDGKIFDQIVYTYGIADGVRDGYLSPLVSPKTSTELNVNGVHTKSGEFNEGELQAAALDGDYIQNTAMEIKALGEKRRGWLIFCTGVVHAWEMKKAFDLLGIDCGVITGETPDGERDRLIRAYKSQQLRCLASVGVLTTGFNARHVDLIALCRATLSTGLYVQMLGRGTRLSPETSKADCLVLDFAGNIRRHGPVDMVEVRTGGGNASAKPGDVRAKECPGCGSLISIQARLCPHCDHVWPEPPSAPKHSDRADTTTPVMASTAQPEWIPVVDMELVRRQKQGKPPTLCVSYLGGVIIHREWICFEHSGFARAKAAAWWRAMGGQSPTPATVAEALEREQAEILQPSHIMVRPNGQYWEIINRKFEAAAPRAQHEAIDDEFLPF